jgi:hypothetical protein
MAGFATLYPLCDFVHRIHPLCPQVPGNGKMQ